MPKYKTSEIEKLMSMGEKTLAIIAYESVGTPTGVSRMRATIQQVGMTSMMRSLPTGYTEALQTLIKQYSTREGK